MFNENKTEEEYAYRCVADQFPKKTIKLCNKYVWLEFLTDLANSGDPNHTTLEEVVRVFDLLIKNKAPLRYFTFKRFMRMI